VRLSSGLDEVILTTRSGQAIRFREREVRPSGRATAGVTAIRLGQGDAVVGLGIITKKKEEKERAHARLLILTAHGYGKQTRLAEYKLQRRGGKGIKTAKVTAKTGPVIAAEIVDDATEELIVFSEQGQALRMELGGVRVAGRATQGVKLMDLGEGDSLVGLACL